METFRTFGSVIEAREYRYNNGTGGWIFAEDNDGIVILFPPDHYPSAIFTHPLTKGRNGRLIGNQ